MDPCAGKCRKRNQACLKCDPGLDRTGQLETKATLFTLRCASDSQESIKHSVPIRATITTKQLESHEQRIIDRRAPSSMSH